MNKAAMKYVKLNPAVLPLLPSKRALVRFDFILNLVKWVGKLSLKKRVKSIEVIGREHLSGGSKFILMNHSCPLDPSILTFFGEESFQFLVTEPYMAGRKIARFLAWMGQIPKRKLDPDTRSIRTMKQWCEVGGKVASFPEGQFSWDGSPLPLQPGLGELVRYLDVPVVTVRLINADRLWPAWAKVPRRTSLRLEVDEPKTFMPGESVEEYVARRLYVDPETCKRFPVEGTHLAEGLSSFFRFCFSCATDGSLKDDQNQLHCENCKKTWEVRTDHSLKSGSEVISIKHAWEMIRESLKKTWSSTGVNLKSEGKIQLIDASRSVWIPLEESELILQDSQLILGSFRLDLKDLKAHTLDWGDLILLRTERKRYALRLPNDSRAVWTFALNEGQAARAI